jgi:hypothetical protein
MTSNPNEARKALRKIAEAMARDLMDAPLEEALKELRETSGTAMGRGEEIRRDVTALVTRLKKERLIAARHAYDQEASHRTRPSLAGVIEQSREMLLAKVNEILARQPDLRLAFRERNGSDLTERELATILEDLRDLEKRARDKAAG